MIYIMLPAYNEAQGIGRVLTRIEGIASRGSERFRVIVIDDGSSDQTKAEAEAFTGRLDLKVVRFERNRGVGEVFRTGLQMIAEESREPESDIVVTMDSDNTQDPELLVSMIGQIRREGIDLVIASRFASGGRMEGCPWVRRVMSYAVSWLFRCLVRVPGVRDYSTFYRAFRVCLLHRGLDAYGEGLIEGTGFAVVSGLLIKLGNLTDRIAEVPLVLRYDLKRGRSGNRLFRSIVGYLQLLWACLSRGRFRSRQTGALRRRDVIVRFP